MKRVYIFLTYLLLSCIITFPLVLNLNKILIGWPLDAYNYLWNIDTFWKQILVFKNPFFTDRIFYPLGTYLIFHTYAPIISLPALPFLKNLPLYLNLLILLSLTISSLAVFNLLKHMTKKNLPSFLGGILYGFSPIMISFLISQHYYFAFAAPFPPLGIFFLTRYFEEGKTKDLLLLIVSFWVTMAIDYYTAIIFFISAIIFSVVFLVTDSKDVIKITKKNIKNVFVVVFLLLVVPGLVIFSLLNNNSASSKFLESKSFYPTICSASPQRLFTPSEFNPILKNLESELRPKFNIPKNYDTPSIFLGFTIPLLAILAVFLLPPKRTLPILGIGLFILLFSLGPTTKIFGLITRIPPLGLIDCPQRFIIGVQMSLAILAGLTLFKLSKVRFNKLILGLAGIIIITEYFSWNLPRSIIEIPQVYKNLSKVPSNKTVLELPSGIAESKGAFGYDWSIQGLLLKQMYWQTLSGKSRIGGYTSRLDKSYYAFFENEPIISNLFRMTSLNGNWDNKSFTDQEISSFINKFNLGFIILSPNQRQLYFSSVVEKLFEKRIFEKKTEGGYILYTLN